MPALGTVVESPPRNACRATTPSNRAFGKADGVHIIARGEECSGQPRRPASLSFEKFRNSRMLLTGRPLNFLDVAQQRLGDPLLLLVAKTKLHRVISRRSAVSCHCSTRFGPASTMVYRGDSPTFAS